MNRVAIFSCFVVLLALGDMGKFLINIRFYDRAVVERDCSIRDQFSQQIFQSFVMAGLGIKNGISKYLITNAKCVAV
jgi:hypothetical protein